MPARIRRRLRSAHVADHIAKHSLETAIRFIENAEATISELAERPSTGSPFDSDRPELENVRFRRVNGFPNHVIFYVERSDAIEILRILHGSRDIVRNFESSGNQLAAFLLLS